MPIVLLIIRQTEARQRSMCVVWAADSHGTRGTGESLFDMASVSLSLIISIDVRKLCRIVIYMKHMSSLQLYLLIYS